MKRVWVCGDIHGSFKPIRDFELRNKEKYTKINKERNFKIFKANKCRLSKPCIL